MKTGRESAREVPVIAEVDVRDQARCEDSIGIFPELIDGHGVLVLPTTGRYFEISCGVLLPQRVENLLVAGRCIAGDELVRQGARIR